MLNAQFVGIKRLVQKARISEGASAGLSDLSNRLSLFLALGELGHKVSLAFAAVIDPGARVRMAAGLQAALVAHRVAYWVDN